MGIIKFIILGVSIVVNAVVTLTLLVCLDCLDSNGFDRAVDKFTERIKKLWEAGNFFWQMYYSVCLYYFTYFGFAMHYDIPIMLFLQCLFSALVRDRDWDCAFMFS